MPRCVLQNDQTCKGRRSGGSSRSLTDNAGVFPDTLSLYIRQYQSGGLGNQEVRQRTQDLEILLDSSALLWILPVSKYLINIFVIGSNDLKKKRKKANKREPHPEGGGHVLPFQFPHRQIVMNLLCEEILWNFASKIWWLPYSIVHTMIIWKCSKVLVLPPQKTPTRLYS